MKKIITTTVIIITIGFFAVSAKAVIAFENLDAPSLTLGTHDYGQSFATPVDLFWNNLTVNLWSVPGNPASSPFAAGTLFLLSEEYLGSQEDLNLTTLGFIAQTSIIENDLWIFEQSVTLLPDTQYWFYTQGSMISPIAFSSASNPFAGGIAYQDIGSGYGSSAVTDLGFSIQGNAIPEPSSVAFLMGGAVAVFTVLRRRKR